MTGSLGFPAGRAVALDDRVRVWGDAAAVLGGAPFGVVRIASPARAFVRRLSAAGAGGVVPSPGVEHAVVDLLLARGIVHPVVVGADVGDTSVDVVVPAFERADLLRTCLESLRVASPRARIIVVDDGSTDDAVAEAARAAGAVLVRHPVNRGPAAARNTGLREANSTIVAFVDADCAVTNGWLEPLVAHFDDPRVAAVAPRIRPRSQSPGLLARYQDGRSALDMGARQELVTYGAPLGFLPSATVLVRRSAVGDQAFDEELRLGEDVDLVWRLDEQGGMVRYEPASTVSHETRAAPLVWARRIFDYGTSAAALDRRHPQRLAPARFSGWNLTIAALLLARRPSAGLRTTTALAVAATATALLARSLRSSAVDPRVAPLVIGRTMTSDAESAGHLLRREWWPVGWLALLSARRSRVGLAATATMLIPVIREWRRNRPEVDLPRYLLLRLVEDAAYGSGVIAGAVTGRRPGVLLPRARLPYLPRRQRRS